MIHGNTWRRVLFTLAIAGAASPGADFWQKTKFADWSEKEVRKMLFDSPWAKGVEVRLSAGSGRAVPRTGGRGGRRGAQMGGVSDASMGSGDAMSGGRMGGEAGGGFGAADSVPTTTVTVRWHTALPVKQAIARSRYGSEAAASPEAAKIFSRQETQYVVGIIGLPMQALRGNPAQLKSRASLKIKGKEPIAAADVVGDRQERGVNVYLFFSRKPEIMLADEEVEVSLKLPSSEIRRKFKLKDMVYEGKLEI